jgi:hypothetical protein
LGRFEDALQGVGYKPDKRVKRGAPLLKYEGLARFARRTHP